MSERFIFTEPVLRHYNYDLSKDWFVQFTYTDCLTGKKAKKQYRGGINFKKTIRERERRALLLIKGLREEFVSGYNPTSDGVRSPKYFLLTEAIDNIVEMKNATNRLRTNQTYLHNAKVFKEWLTDQKMENVLLADFKTNQAGEYMDYLVIKKKYSGRTHNDHLTNLKTFFNAMIEREWITKNPFKGIKKKPTTIGRNLAYSDEERSRLRAHLYESDRRLFYFTEIMYYCFIRRTELSRLQVSHFDLQNNTIIIPAEVSKNKSQESVVIPKGLDETLKEMNLQQYSPEDFVFGSCLQTSFHQYKNPNHISTRHAKHVKKLTMDSEKGLYSHKHTGVCRAYYATGKDVYSLMRQLRHRDLNTTMIYLKSLGLVQNDVFRNAMVE